MVFFDSGWPNAECLARRGERLLERQHLMPSWRLERASHQTDSNWPVLRLILYRFVADCPGFQWLCAETKKDA
ncbi:hypothetical protein AZH11_19420 [Pseudomonas simiae]|nr:hypothetical protein AZH11_19420 [Pseudomonas simiae]